MGLPARVAEGQPAVCGRWVCVASARVACVSDARCVGYASVKKSISYLPLRPPAAGPAARRGVE